MCKRFKITTKTGLVTETTDQEIVRCLMDNYDDELTISVYKHKDNTEINEDNGKFCFNVKPLSVRENKILYVKELKELLNLHLASAKQAADEGFKYTTNSLKIVEELESILRKYNTEYTIGNCY